MLFFLTDAFASIASAWIWPWTHVLCLRHGILVWQLIGQSTTATNQLHNQKSGKTFKDGISREVQQKLPIRKMIQVVHAK